MRVSRNLSHWARLHSRHVSRTAALLRRRIGLCACEPFPDGQTTTFMTWWRCPKCQQLSGDMGSVIPVIPSPSDPIDPSTRDAVGTLPADPIVAARDTEERGMLRRALALDPRWRAALLTERVNVLCARRQPHEALQAADGALQLTPASPYARYVRGRALGLLGRLDEAEAEMERILRDAPGYGDATRAKELYAAARQRMQSK